MLGVMTDSTCDLPVATLKRIGVEAVPLWVLVGEERYRDWRDLEPGTLFEWMQTQGVTPVVRSPDPEDFMAAYRNHLKHFDSIVSIHLSQRFSRTFENARLAAERLGVGDRVTLLDSGFAGAGLAEVVLSAAELARKGANLDLIVKTGDRIREGLYGVVSPTDSSWRGNDGKLRRFWDGRRGSLGHRPLFGMDDGSLVPLGWSRRDRVFEEMSRQLRRKFGETPVAVAVASATSDDHELARLREAVESSGMQIAHGRVQLIGAALSARLGPGSAAVFARPLTAGTALL